VLKLSLFCAQIQLTLWLVIKLWTKNFFICFNFFILLFNTGSFVVIIPWIYIVCFEWLHPPPYIPNSTFFLPDPAPTFSNSVGGSHYAICVCVSHSSETMFCNNVHLFNVIRLSIIWAFHYENILSFISHQLSCTSSLLIFSSLFSLLFFLVEDSFDVSGTRLVLLESYLFSPVFQPLVLFPRTLP
jgi:hypothetical protein